MIKQKHNKNTCLLKNEDSTLTGEKTIFYDIHFLHRNLDKPSSIQKAR